MGLAAAKLSTLDGFCIAWHEDGRILSCAEALVTLRDKPGAGEYFGAALGSLGFDGIYWECAVIGPSTMNRAFECVALRADHFVQRRPDPQAFANQFAKAGPDEEVVCFPSLGGDSGLVAPLPVGDVKSYGHIGSFVKHASTTQVGAFFSCLGKQALLWAETRQVWLSTAGDAVAWLHGRLDTWPKYYNYGPYIAEFRSGGLSH